MIDRQATTGTQDAGRDRHYEATDGNEAAVREADKLPETREEIAMSIPPGRHIGVRPSFDPPAEPEWHRMIAAAAYFRAEKRDFDAGHALDDWLLAEQEVKRVISP
jgi:DUF2934 family protein